MSFNTQSYTPCKDCANRTPGCHGRCDSYLVWRQKKDELNKKLNRDAECRRVLSEGEIRHFKGAGHRLNKIR